MNHLSDIEKAQYLQASRNNSFGGIEPSIHNHILECFECRNSIVDLLGLFESEAGIKRVHHNAWIKYAVAAAMIPILGWALYRWIAEPLVPLAGIPLEEPVRKLEQTVIVPEISQENDIKKTNPVNRSLIADNFQPNPSLEYLAGSQVRAEAITIVAPELNASLSGDISFHWKSENILHIRILNNRGDVIHAAKSKDQYRLEEKLSAGLYYWKLETEDDVIYIGKFFIR